MEFKITIILSHIENQSVEDMELNAQNYIKEFIEDGELYIESIENITINKKNPRKEMIDFIVEFASDEIETINDALKIARMTNQELKEDIKSIKEYYKREHKTTI